LLNKILRFFGLYRNPYEIPDGTYCYTFLGVAKDLSVVHTKPCPYYKHKDCIIGYCRFCGREVIDRVKECGLFEKENV